MKKIIYFVIYLNYLNLFSLNAFGDSIPDGQKFVIHSDDSNQCLIVENNSGQDIFIPNKTASEVLSLANSNSAQNLSLETCSNKVFSASGVSYDDARNLNDPNENYTVSDTVHSLNYGFGPNMMTCVRRTTVPTHTGSRCNNPPTNFIYANTNSQFTYDSNKDIWYQIKPIAPSGLAAGGKAFLTRYNPDISTGSLVWGVNATRVTWQINL